MKRKILVLLMLSLALVLAACGSKDPESGGALTLSEHALTLEKYEDTTLSAQLTGADDTVLWSSSDNTTVTVDAGKLIALKAGEAVVTATAGEYSDSCTVTVTDNGLMPTVVADYDTFEMFTGTSFQIGAAVSFKGNTYTDGIFEYSSSDETVATVSGEGVVTAAAWGSASITVLGSWRGAPQTALSAVIPVTVSENVAITVDTERVQLYVTAEVDGTPFDTVFELDATVTADGKTIVPAAGSVEWTSQSEAVADVDDGVITAYGVGSTRVRATYTSPGGFVVHSQWVDVDVAIPVVSKDITPIDVDATDDALPAAFAQLTGVPITAVLDGQTDLGYSDGAVNVDALVTGEREWTVMTETFGYTVPVIVASKIITVRDELELMYTDYLKTDTPGHYEGYIILDADLDFTDYTYLPGMWGIVGFGFSSYDTALTEWDSQWADTATKGFEGTFDGRGHTISNIKISPYGLFPAITAGSVFKNTAFSDITLSIESAAVAACLHGTVDNVSVTVKTFDKWEKSGAVVLRAMSGSTISNVMVYAPGATAYSQTVGAVARMSFAGCTLENVYAISDAGAFNTADNGAEIPDTGIIYASDAEFAAEKDKVDGMVDLGGFNEYWNKTGQLPVFQSTLAGGCVIADRTDLQPGGQATLSANLQYVRYAVSAREAIAPYISVSGQTVTVTAALNTVMNDTETFTVAASLFGAQVKTIEFTVTRIEKQLVELTGNLFDFDKSLETAYSVTLPADYADIPMSGTFKIGDTPVAYTASETSGVTTLTVAAGSFVDVAAGEYTFSLETDSKIYRQPVIVASVIIDSEDEFLQIYDNLKTDVVGTYDGYVLLADDLDFDGMQYNKSPWNVEGFCTLTYDIDMGNLADADWNAMDSSTGFCGTFDGRGHRISNLTLRTYGLFVRLAESGTVKNVSFLDCIFNGDDTATVAKYNEGTIDNVFVTVKTLPASGKVRSGALCENNSGTINGCLVYYYGITEYKNFGALAYTGTGTVTDTFCITDGKAVADAEIDGCTVYSTLDDYNAAVANETFPTDVFGPYKTKMLADFNAAVSE